MDAIDGLSRLLAARGNRQRVRDVAPRLELYTTSVLQMPVIDSIARGANKLNCTTRLSAAASGAQQRVHVVRYGTNHWGLHRPIHEP